MKPGTPAPVGREARDAGPYAAVAIVVGWALALVVGLLNNDHRRSHR